MKYTGIYPMLPEEVQEFLGTCGYEAKKETMEVLATLSAESSFSKVAEAVRAALSHGAIDVDGVLAILNGLSGGIIDLDPLVLSADVSEIPQ